MIRSVFMSYKLPSPGVYDSLWSWALVLQVPTYCVTPMQPAVRHFTLWISKSREWSLGQGSFTFTRFTLQTSAVTQGG